jgi:hypothetical protein
MLGPPSLKKDEHSLIIMIPSFGIRINGGEFYIEIPDQRLRD